MPANINSVTPTLIKNSDNVRELMELMEASWQPVALVGFYAFFS
jgi:hypothetical protein